MNEDQDGAVMSMRTASLLRLSLDALAARSLKFCTMLLAFVLAGACVVRPHWISLAAAGLFAAMVCPVWWRREKRDG